MRTHVKLRYCRICYVNTELPLKQLFLRTSHLILMLKLMSPQPLAETNCLIRERLAASLHLNTVIGWLLL